MPFNSKAVPIMNACSTACREVTALLCPRNSLPLKDKFATVAERRHQHRAAKSWRQRLLSTLAQVMQMADVAWQSRLVRV
jgi:hypothetical protein